MIRAVILDLDGTVYTGHVPVPGAADFVSFARDNSIRPLFVTNRSNRLPAEIVRHLGECGIPCGEPDVLTTSEATASHLQPGRAFCIGEKGLTETLAAAGFSVTDENPDYVIVSFDRHFDYAKLEKASRLIEGGADFIATNPDCGLKTDKGIVPGTGAIVAAVRAATGREPVMIGKPARIIMDMALKRLRMPAVDVICVGDNVTTDIPSGAAAGMRTALLLTGVSRREDADSSPVKPDWILDSFAGLVSLVARENGIQPVGQP